MHAVKFTSVLADDSVGIYLLHALSAYIVMVRARARARGKKTLLAALIAVTCLSTILNTRIDMIISPEWALL